MISMHRPGWRTLTFAAVFLSVAAGVAAGLRVVPQGHRGAVVRLGTLRPELLAPGMHWVPPWPVAEVRAIPTELILQIRLEPFAEGGIAERASEFLTGDANLLEAAVRLDYRVIDPLEIARTGLDRVESRLVPLAEASLVSTLSGVSIAEALGPGRETLARTLRENVQKQVDRQALGIRIVGVVWVELTPPKEVRRDFEEAQAAVSQGARTVAEADRAAAAESLAVTGETAAILTEAETSAQSARAAAKAEAQGFGVLLRQARRTGYGPTVRELWLATIDKILPALKGRTVLATDQPVDMTIIRQGAEVPVPASLPRP